MHMMEEGGIEVQKKTMVQVVLENRLERLIRRQKTEVELLQLIDQMSPGEFKEGIRRDHLADLAKCEFDIAQICSELKNSRRCL